jgi:hypothetical protein
MLDRMHPHLQGVLVERLPMGAVRRVLDAVNAAYGESVVQTAGVDGATRRATSRAAAVLSPEVLPSYFLRIYLFF